MALTSWYGPLIDLSRAASHVDDYVQLLVFVHRITPVPYKHSKGKETIRADVQVGDDTRPFFPVTIWQKQLGARVVAGDVILLQNVRIARFGGAVEATTLHHSSVLSLVQSSKLLLDDMEDVLRNSRVGITTKEKLRKVMKWVLRSGSTLCSVRLYSAQDSSLVKNALKGLQSRNWKQKETKSQDCSSVSQVLRLTNSCKATFCASLGEIILPLTWASYGEYSKERMFVSHRMSRNGDNYLVQDFICIGCRFCFIPLDEEHGQKFDQDSISLFCAKSTNHRHTASSIYRPFLLYVWDESDYIPLLVRNKAAELLFGNITAEKVYSCHRGQKYDQCLNKARSRLHDPVAAVADPLSPNTGEMVVDSKEKQQTAKNYDFYSIWRILLKILLQQGKSSPLKLEVNVDLDLDEENGRFELKGVSMPCQRR
ncbi:hypothetical protein RJ641_031949 [Dillenia turbinata]|uniref:Uncharacterized protein n=1 Tax=Dillenia turbinata TaxID=194707 RepID=A0AAN8VZ38_9MAGN